MNCPNCGSKTKVIEGRMAVKSNGFSEFIKRTNFDLFYARRRKCPDCEEVFRTVEVDIDDFLEMFDESPHSKLKKQWNRMRCRLIGAIDDFEEDVMEF